MKVAVPTFLFYSAPQLIVIIMRSNEIGQPCLQLGSGILLFALLVNCVSFFFFFFFFAKCKQKSARRMN